MGWGMLGALLCLQQMHMLCVVCCLPSVCVDIGQATAAHAAATKLLPLPLLWHMIACAAMTHPAASAGWMRRGSARRLLSNAVAEPAVLLLVRYNNPEPD